MWESQSCNAPHFVHVVVNVAERYYMPSLSFDLLDIGYVIEIHSFLIFMTT